MNIWVVDDEPRQRRGMEEIIRSILPGGDILSFKDGAQVLACARETKVDILFSDIRMPKMTGLELATQLLVIRPEAIIILVSVYADFDYARRAIELGAFGYILKPVSVDAVREILLKAAARVDERKKEAFAADQKTMNQALTVYQEHLFKKWICGRAGREEERELRAFLPEFECGFFLSMSLGETADRIEDVEEMKFNMTEWLHQCLPAVRIYGFVDHCCVDILIIAVLGRESDQECRMSLERFLRGINREYDMPVYAIVGDSFRNSPGAVHEAYTAMREILPCFFYSPFDRILYREDWPALTENMPLETAAILNRIHARALEGENEETVQALAALFASLPRNSLPRPMVLIEVVSHTLLTILDAMGEFIPDEGKSGLTKKILLLKGCGSFCAFQEQTEQLLLFMMEEYKTGKQALSPVRQAIRYIHEHYSQDISLPMLAEKYHYSPSYFSSMFKTVTGENMVSYVNRLRLEKALEYFSVTSMKNHEIAKKVGLNDYKYFNRLFKKKYGCTVQEYRRRLAEKGGKHENLDEK